MYWGEYRSADFEAEWEPVSDDIIKIYDYDGHDEKWNGFNGLYHRRTGRWSMYLKSNGAFSHDQSSLNNPDGYLEKQ